MEKCKTQFQKVFLLLGGLIFTLALFLPNTGGAHDYYVSPNGNDTNAGTITDPFRSIKIGLQGLEPGDTLFIKGGTYAEILESHNGTNFPFGTSWENSVTVAAFPGEQVTLKGRIEIGFEEPLTKYVIFDGITIDAMGHTSGVSIQGGSHHIRFRNVEVKNAIGYAGISTSYSADPNPGGEVFNEFINMGVHHNGIEDNLTAGFSIKTSGNLIEYCEIYDNSGGAIHVNGGAEGPRTKGNIFRDNRIRNNGREGITINRSDDNLIYNNMVWNNENGILVGPFGNPKGTKVYQNTVYANQKYGIGVFAGAIDTEVLNNISHDISTNIFACSIMPLGDSITYDNNRCDVQNPATPLPQICGPGQATLEYRRSPGKRTGYRKPLLELLEAAGYQHQIDFDFVGSERGGGDLMIDPDNAGFPRISSVQLAELLQTGTYQDNHGHWLDIPNGTWYGDNAQWAQTKPPQEWTYLDRYHADIILLHIGTNGMPLNSNPNLEAELIKATENVENILKAIDDYEKKHQKKVMVIVAGIINRACSLAPADKQWGCLKRRLPTAEFNIKVKAMVDARKNDDIAWVDMEAALVDNRPDMIDDLHPDEPGYKKMAAVWKEALVKINLPPRCNLTSSSDTTPPVAPQNLRLYPN